MGDSGNLLLLIELVIYVLTTVGMWKVFTMAGKPGWWILLLLVPFLNILVLIFALIALARSFGKGVGFGLGLTFLPFVFFPVLGFTE